MRYEIILLPEAIQDIRQLPARDAGVIRSVLEQFLRHEPQKVSKSRIKRLRSMSRPQYRLRIDGFRVYYDVEGFTVYVLAVVPKVGAAQWVEKWGEAEP
jgi:mRNA-degrading endonuclease RelE of RelBE toxin-antitoxin system